MFMCLCFQSSVLIKDNSKQCLRLPWSPIEHIYTINILGAIILKEKLFRMSFLVVCVTVTVLMQHCAHGDKTKSFETCSGPCPWVECCEILPAPYKASTKPDFTDVRTSVTTERVSKLSVTSAFSCPDFQVKRDSSFLLACAVTVGMIIYLHNQGNGAQFKASIITNAELEASHYLIMFLLLFLYIQPSAACAGHVCCLLGTDAVWGDRHRLSRDVLVFAGRRRRVVFVRSCL